MTSSVVDDIKKRGYWRINFRPSTLAYSLPDLPECLSAITKNKVSLRGWSYPYVPLQAADHKGVTPGDKYYEGWINSGMHRELWRMYLSTQFLHYRSLWDDWRKEDPLFGSANAPEPGSTLSIIGGVYQITEIYEFLRRLVQDNLYDSGVGVNISLHNTKGRKLLVDDPFRAPLFGEYKTGAETITFEKSYEKDEIVLQSKDLAFECIDYFFKRFGWNQPNEIAIRDDQDKLLSGRP